MGDKMREEFEAWVKSEFDGYLPLRDGDGYTIKYIDGAWNGWKASRAALCVKLPASFGNPRNDFNDGFEQALNWCKDALDGAGVRCK